MADLGVAQLHDMREHAEMIANLDPQGPPLIADMDTGYGGKLLQPGNTAIKHTDKVANRRSDHGYQLRPPIHPRWCRRIPH